MPDKPQTVAAYAAGASLAAIVAFYVFGPTFFIDGENSSNTSDGRKRTIIGLANSANDCFINSVLQALAGLGDLRVYLIRELHRRQLDGSEVLDSLPLVLQKGETEGKLRTLQRGPVTQALKDMLDALNERPIYKKTISARPMIEALERAFQTRISRNQQDAQEFLQIVLERLCDEYHAAEKARRRCASPAGDVDEERDEQDDRAIAISKNDRFPFEGRIETQIQCLHCGFKTKASATTFVSLTLNVPQKSSTSLDKCFDILLKREDIDDYICDKCRLRHALEWKAKLLERAKTDKDKDQLKDDIALLERAVADDPEKAPEGVVLPDSKDAPRRKIQKHTRITVFPKVIAIHLSRSVFDPQSYSSKNMAKVSYTQRLRLGGLLNEKWYKLLGVVCHKGNHNSGHYESFRRNHLYPPFATPAAFSAYAAASQSVSRTETTTSSPSIDAMHSTYEKPSEGDRSSSSASTPPTSPESSRPTSKSIELPNAAPPASPSRAESSKLKLQRTETQNSRPQIRTHDSTATSKFRRKKKSNDRWWRISDDKIKEARTSDVLSMQREVYLLFYELEREGDDAIS